MQKHSEKAAGFAFILALVALIVDVLLARRTGLLALPFLVPFHILTLCVTALVTIRLRLRRMADDERRDLALAGGAAASATLFENNENGEPFSIDRSREQFEKYFVPVVAPLLAILLGLWAWRLLGATAWRDAESSDHLLATAFLVGQAFFLFLLSRYLHGLGRHEDHRLLRGPAITTGITALASLVTAAGAGLTGTVYPGADRLSAIVLMLALALLAAEMVVRFLVYLYQPRRKKAVCTSYESKIGSMLTDPAGLARSVAQALDYQFGFQVSETWFYRLLRSALVPLLVLQGVLLYGMTCFVFLAPHEQAILERFGAPRGEQAILQSGFHLKLPWPFETIRRYPAGRIQTTYVGFEKDEDGRLPKILLWTIPHFKSEDQFVVPSRTKSSTGTGGSVPVNLVTMNVPIEYRITNLLDYAYQVSDPQKALRQLAYHVVTREVSGRDLFDLMGASRLDVADQLKAGIQQACNAQRLGVEIVAVALPSVHPPVAVADAFQGVVGALEEREASILLARAYTNSLLPVALAEADKAAAEADAYRTRRGVVAEAETEQFTSRLAAYKVSPEVFRMRAYLGTLETTLAPVRKYIVDAPQSREVIYLNFRESSFPSVLDLGLPTSEQELSP